MSAGGKDENNNEIFSLLTMIYCHRSYPNIHKMEDKLMITPLELSLPVLDSQECKRFASDFGHWAKKRYREGELDLTYVKFIGAERESNRDRVLMVPEESAVFPEYNIFGKRNGDVDEKDGTPKEDSEKRCEEALKKDVEQKKDDGDDSKKDDQKKATSEKRVIIPKLFVCFSNCNDSLEVALRDVRKSFIAEKQGVAHYNQSPTKKDDETCYEHLVELHTARSPSRNSSDDNSDGDSVLGENINRFGTGKFEDNYVGDGRRRRSNSRRRAYCSRERNEGRAPNERTRVDSRRDGGRDGGRRDEDRSCRRDEDRREGEPHPSPEGRKSREKQETRKGNNAKKSRGQNEGKKNSGQARSNKNKKKRGRNTQCSRERDSVDEDDGKDTRRDRSRSKSGSEGSRCRSSSPDPATKNETRTSATKKDSVTTNETRTSATTDASALSRESVNSSIVDPDGDKLKRSSSANSDKSYRRRCSPARAKSPMIKRRKKKQVQADNRTFREHLEDAKRARQEATAKKRARAEERSHATSHGEFAKKRQRGDGRSLSCSSAEGNGKKRSRKDKQKLVESVLEACDESSGKSRRQNSEDRKMQEIKRKALAEFEDKILDACPKGESKGESEAVAQAPKDPKASDPPKNESPEQGSPPPTKRESPPQQLKKEITPSVPNSTANHISQIANILGTLPKGEVQAKSSIPAQPLSDVFDTNDATAARDDAPSGSAGEANASARTSVNSSAGSSDSYLNPPRRDGGSARADHDRRRDCSRNREDRWANDRRRRDESRERSRERVANNKRNQKQNGKKQKNRKRENNISAAGTNRRNGKDNGRKDSPKNERRNLNASRLTSLLTDQLRLERETPEPAGETPEREIPEHGKHTDAQGGYDSAVISQAKVDAVGSSTHAELVESVQPVSQPVSQPAQQVTQQRTQSQSSRPLVKDDGYQFGLHLTAAEEAAEHTRRQLDAANLLRDQQRPLSDLLKAPPSDDEEERCYEEELSRSADSSCQDSAELSAEKPSYAMTKTAAIDSSIEGRDPFPSLLDLRQTTPGLAYQAKIRSLVHHRDPAKRGILLTIQLQEVNPDTNGDTEVLDPERPGATTEDLMEELMDMGKLETKLKSLREREHACLRKAFPDGSFDRNTIAAMCSINIFESSAYGECDAETVLGPRRNVNRAGVVKKCKRIFDSLNTDTLFSGTVLCFVPMCTINTEDQLRIGDYARVRIVSRGKKFIRGVLDELNIEEFDLI